MSAKSPLRARRRISPESGFLGGLIDPIDRLSETIFSILILLTFTLAFRVLRLSDNSGQVSSAENVNELLIGALGAVLAWGVIDGVMYALIAFFERGERHRLLNKIQSAESDPEAVEAIAADLDYILEPISNDGERRLLYQSILEHLRNSQPRRIGFKREDFTGALGHVLVAILSVLPSLIPLFLFRHNDELAIRASNLVSFIVLFIVGYHWGKYTGANAWKTGLLLMTVAVVMVLIAIPLGG
jgi:VIT1/CCC1 family predicted Fe2+/Mn2+ transporter